MARKYLWIGIAALAAALLEPSQAMPASALSSAVLTVGSVGGPMVDAGDQLSGPGQSQLVATFCTTAGGSTCVRCATTSWQGRNATNPPMPGTATLDITSWTFGSCTSNLPGVTSVISATVQNLPYSMTISDGAGSAVTITGSIQLTLRLGLGVGSLTCQYQTTSISGTFADTNSATHFANQQLTRSTGGAGCPTTLFFSETYAPVADVSMAGSPAVFVN